MLRLVELQTSIIVEYLLNTFIVNIDAVKEYNRLKWDNTFEYCDNIAVNESSLTVTLLNTCSLKTHTIDLAKESWLMESDISWHFMSYRKSSQNWSGYL